MRLTVHLAGGLLLVLPHLHEVLIGLPLKVGDGISRPLQTVTKSHGCLLAIFELGAHQLQSALVQILLQPL